VASRRGSCAITGLSSRAGSSSAGNASAASRSTSSARASQSVDDAYIELFNGKLRDECLDEQYFLDLTDAHRTIERWRRHYIRARPYSALGRATPVEYVARLTLDPDLSVLKQR
jgi:transposase InsO family protein